MVQLTGLENIPAATELAHSRGELGHGLMKLGSSLMRFLVWTRDSREGCSLHPDPQRPRASPSSPGMNLRTPCKQEVVQGHTAVMFSFLHYSVCCGTALATDPMELNSLWAAASEQPLTALWEVGFRKFHELVFCLFA